MVAADAAEVPPDVAEPPPAEGDGHAADAAEVSRDITDRFAGAPDEKEWRAEGGPVSAEASSATDGDEAAADAADGRPVEADSSLAVVVDCAQGHDMSDAADRDRDRDRERAGAPLASEHPAGAAPSDQSDTADATERAGDHDCRDPSEAAVSAEDGRLPDCGLVQPSDDPDLFRATEVGIEGLPEAPAASGAGAGAAAARADNSKRRPGRARVPNFDPPLSMPDEELDIVLKKLITKKVVPDAELRPSVVVYARKRASQHLVQEEYDQAAACDAVIELLTAMMRADGVADDVSEQTKELQMRLAQCEQNNRSLLQEKRNLQEGGRSELKRQLARLEAKHEQQRQEFEGRWSCDEARIPFSKPSVQLLQLRQQQKALALLHQFRTAKSLKQQADVMERREGEEATRRYEQALKISWEQLMEEQAKEKQCLVENRDLRLLVQTTVKEKEIWSNDLTQESLKQRISEPKHQKRPTIYVPAPKGPARPASAGAPNPSYAMVTQRTRSQLLLYRTTPDVQRLELTPAKVASIVKPTARKAKRPE
jgi:hypothetical protein